MYFSPLILHAGIGIRKINCKGQLRYFVLRFIVNFYRAIELLLRILLLEIHEIRYFKLTLTLIYL